MPAIMPGAPEVLVVHDTVLDSRFRDNLLVWTTLYPLYAAPNSIFVQQQGEQPGDDFSAQIFQLLHRLLDWCSFLLVTGVQVGTVCAIDRKPRNAFTVKISKFSRYGGGCSERNTPFPSWYIARDGGESKIHHEYCT